MAVTYHGDGLGSIRALTDAAEAVTDRWRFTAFGELLEHVGSDENAYLFAGEPYDPNSGFYYNRARWMDPGVGRFLSQDPSPGSQREPASLHRYLYVADDPVNNLDPSGRQTVASQVAALSARVAVTTANMGARVGARFSSGGVGNLFRALGRYAEAVAAKVFSYLPQIAVRSRDVVVGGRKLDFLLRAGQSLVYLEVRFSLPSRTGRALTRIVGQIQAGLATGQQMVIWSLRAPSTAQLKSVADAVGLDAASRVQFVHGFEGLYRWAQFFVRP